MGKLNLVKRYQKYVQSLGRGDRAMEYAVGGDFEVIGVLERAILIQYGLQPNDYVIDVGCGSGRLAKPLSAYLHGPYLGIDVVRKLVDHARALVDRPDWRFETTGGIKIPERDDAADMVCFFSVFTHVLHEQSYTYLREARRVPKPGGRAVFSFLEFAVPAHWPLFENAVAHIGGQRPLTVFLDQDAIDAWGAHLHLSIVATHTAGDPHIPLPQPLTRDDGTVITGPANLGQSVCVLEKPTS
jgi:SAM-dependent methyltransferase